MNKNTQHQSHTTRLCDGAQRRSLGIPLAQSSLKSFLLLIKEVIGFRKIKSCLTCKGWEESDRCYQCLYSSRSRDKRNYRPCNFVTAMRQIHQAKKEELNND